MKGRTGIMKIYKADEKNIRAIGRTVYHDEIRWLGYSCTAVEFEFTGKKLSAEITTDWVDDAEWKTLFKCFLAVFVNDCETPTKRFPLDEGTNSYDIYSSGNIQTVKIRIMKMSENAFSRAGIVSIIADGEISPTASDKNRRIEFIGDSITCGFGDECASASDGFTTATENPWDNYAALTARRLNADFHLVSWTSIGVLSNSVKEDVNEPDDAWVMPKIYGYTDKGMEGCLGLEPKKWDFSLFKPQLIVVNLGTNDKDYTRGIPERTAAFEHCYEEFIREVRRLNPDAYILCALGAMGQELCPQVEEAVKRLDDEKISSLRFEVQCESDGIGAENHPSLATHKKMSHRLLEEINRLNIFGKDGDNS